TSDDYLIPSSVLGATISGLVSRSILNAAVVGPGDFHACLYYDEFVPEDLSRWFVDTLMHEMERQLAVGRSLAPVPLDRERLRRQSAALLDDMTRRYGVPDANHVKPGIGEATRVLLRRVPGLLLLRDPALPEVAHLLLLAREKDVPLTVEPDLPYLAV